MRNAATSDNELLRRGLEVLRRRLPAGWKMEVSLRPSSLDTAVVVKSPDRRQSIVGVELRRRLEPRAAIDLAARLSGKGTVQTWILAPYLTAAVRERLREAGLGYLDLTGNIRISLSAPGLFVEVAGAEANPDREERPARSLRGSKAGRVVRALCDFREPVGVRELATRAGIDPGYASRLLVYLDREALIERGSRGRVERVAWERLLRRWAEQASFKSRGPAVTFLEPRGLASLLARLSRNDLRYALTGSLAASRIAPVAPPRLAAIYVDDIVEAARALDLKETVTGANVILVAPRDDVAFQRTVELKGLTCSAPSQIAADLLTAPGRGPAEADELIAWMTANEASWRG